MFFDPLWVLLAINAFLVYAYNKTEFPYESSIFLTVSVGICLGGRIHTGRRGPQRHIPAMDVRKMQSKPQTGPDSFAE